MCFLEFTTSIYRSPINIFKEHVNNHHVTGCQREMSKLKFVNIDQL